MGGLTMKNCPGCNSEFSLSSKLKALNKEFGEIQCDNCKNIYKKTSNRSIYIGFGLAILLTGTVIYRLFEGIQNMFVKYATVGIIGGILSLVFILLFDIRAKYEIVNKQEKNKINIKK